MCAIFNEEKIEWSEIVSIEYIGMKDTIDIDVDGDHLFYANGILTHNSSVEEVEYGNQHIAGGISKINTADNVIGIFTSRAMREQGRYQLQLMKTRNSSGVGQKIDLAFDVDTLRITDLEEGAEPSMTGNDIISALRGRSSQIVPEAKITAEVGSTKLRSLLNNLPSDD